MSTAWTRRRRIQVAAARALALGGVCLGLSAGMGGCHRVPDPSRFTALSARPAGAVVQLRCAKIPCVSAIAAHCWFAEFDPSDRRWHRWEVWQEAGRGPGDRGHLRKDLMGPARGVGAGGSWALAEWTGAEAARLAAVLHDPQRYPWCETYHYWPGPNSNTYVAWVLREARVPADLPPAAIGKGYRR